MDDEIKKIKDVPQEMIDAYFQMAKGNVKKRIEGDKDYLENRKKGN